MLRLTFITILWALVSDVEYEENKIILFTFDFNRKKNYLYYFTKYLL